MLNENTRRRRKRETGREEIFETIICLTENFPQINVRQQTTHLRTSENTKQGKCLKNYIYACFLKKTPRPPQTPPNPHCS